MVAPELSSRTVLIVLVLYWLDTTAQAVEECCKADSVDQESKLSKRISPFSGKLSR